MKYKEYIIKHCPLCMGNNIEIEEYEGGWDEYNPPYVRIECNDCEYFIEEIYLYNAIDLWNKYNKD
jgi:hypothetical protein